MLSFRREGDSGNQYLLSNLGLDELTPSSQCKYLLLPSKSVVLICVLESLSGSVEREEWTCGQATLSFHQSRSTFHVPFFCIWYK